MMPLKHAPDSKTQGFTLIELSIVLVIIGLLVGGILVGRDLINAASIRAQLSQIEKYQTAVNTFRLKYTALPGDMDPYTAAELGFVDRDGSPGNGDANGVIEGNGSLFANYSAGISYVTGECMTFWEDLGQAGLIDGTFSNGDADNVNTQFINMINEGLVNLPVDPYLPKAKIGAGNYIFVWSGGLGNDVISDWTGSGGSTMYMQTRGVFGQSNGRNYFGLSAITGGIGFSWNSGYFIGNGRPGLTVAQAFAIDNKMDDGFPQSGRVIALYPTVITETLGYTSGGDVLWAKRGNNVATIYIGAGDGSSANSGNVVTCLDNSSTASGTPGVAGSPNHYSTEISGENLNCALSLEFQ